jgi:iron complex transport system substrate-binding protein
VLSRNCNPHDEESQVARCNQVLVSSHRLEYVSLAARDQNLIVMKRALLVVQLVMIFSVMLLAACGGTQAEQANEPQNAPVNAETNDTTVEEPVVEESPEPITLVDGYGREVTLEQPAQQIVSLAPSITEILFAIGAGDQVIGRDDFSNYPEAAVSLPSIGGNFGELNTEAIVALQPDLVLAAELTTQEQVQALQDLGLTVFLLANPVEMEGMYDMLGIAAQLTGRETETEALVASLQERVAAVEETISSAETTPVVFYELDSTDPSAPWTAGPGTFIDTLITMAGGDNLGASFEGAWVQVSSEELLSKNPEIIVLGDAIWGVTVESVEARAGWEGIAAVQNGQIFPFNDDLASRPGPRLVDGLEELAKLIHPELFN